MTPNVIYFIEKNFCCDPLLGSFIVASTPSHKLCYLSLIGDLDAKQKILLSYPCHLPILKETNFLIDVCERLKEYFNNNLSSILDIPLDYSNCKATHFQKRVWNYLYEHNKVKKSILLTYSDLAAAIGSPKAVRSVGSALKKNPILIIIPCHKVVSKCGFGGFNCGLGVKKRLLEIEGLRY